MCPACLATLAMIVMGASSTGGLAALVVNKIRNDTSEKSKGIKQRRTGHEQEHDRKS